MAGGRSELSQLFLQLGYDINHPDDVLRLAADLRWGGERRQSQERFKSRQGAAVGAVILAMLSAAGTITIQWLAKKVGWISS